SAMAVGQSRRRFGTPLHEYIPGRATRRSRQITAAVRRRGRASRCGARCRAATGVALRSRSLGLLGGTLFGTPKGVPKRRETSSPFGNPPAMPKQSRRSRPLQATNRSSAAVSKRLTGRRARLLGSSTRQSSSFPEFWRIRLPEEADVPSLHATYSVNIYP